MPNLEKKGVDFIKSHRSTIVLLTILFLLSCCSLFVGVIDIMPADLFNGDPEQMEIFLISRMPRLLAILCTGIGMSVAGLIMQQLCSNKFYSSHQPDRKRSPLHSLAFCLRCCLCRLPICGVAPFLPLLRQS